MANASLSRQFKRIGAPGISILVLGFVLCMLIAFLEYTHGTKHGDLIGSIFYAVPFPWSLSVGLLMLKGDEGRQAHVPWYKQQFILTGLLLLTLSLIMLMELVNSLMNNGLPDAVGLPILIVAFLLEMFIFVRLTIVLRARARTK